MDTPLLRVRVLVGLPGHELVRSDKEKASFRDPFVRTLTTAGYPPEICSRLFETHVDSLLGDLDGWLAQRRYAEGRRRNGDPTTLTSRWIRVPPQSGQAGAMAPTAPLGAASGRVRR